MERNARRLMATAVRRECASKGCGGVQAGRLALFARSGGGSQESGVRRLLTRTAVLALTAFMTFPRGAASQDVRQNPSTAPGAEERDADDHAIVWELGLAGDWEAGEATVHKGGTIAFEVTPIENWLELEIGVTAIAAGGGVEMPIDVLAKKPWRLSRQFEFMVGAGPELVHASGPEHATFWGLEAVLDFMFWTRKNVGWYVEPGYEVTFRDNASHQGMGIAIGLLIGR